MTCTAKSFARKPINKLLFNLFNNHTFYISSRDAAYVVFLNNIKIIRSTLLVTCNLYLYKATMFQSRNYPYIHSCSIY